MPTAPKDRPSRGKGSQVHKTKIGGKVHEVRGRMAQLMAGELTIEDLDDQELLTGRIRDKNGGFSGRQPALIPRSFHEAITRELLTRGDQLLRENFIASIETFVSIAKDPNVEPKDRLKAAQYVWERIAGKMPDRVDVKAQIEPWQEDIEKIVSREGDE